MNVHHAIDIVYQIGLTDPQLLDTMRANLRRLSDTMKKAQQAWEVDEKEFERCMESANCQSVKLIETLTRCAKADAHVH